MFTAGHSTRSLAEFIVLLGGHSVSRTAVNVIRDTQYSLRSASEPWRIEAARESLRFGYPRGRHRSPQGGCFLGVRVCETGTLCSRKPRVLRRQHCGHREGAQTAVRRNQHPRARQQSSYCRRRALPGYHAVDRFHAIRQGRATLGSDKRSAAPHVRFQQDSRRRRVGNTVQPR